MSTERPFDRWTIWERKARNVFRKLQTVKASLRRCPSNNQSVTCVVCKRALELVSACVLHNDRRVVCSFDRDPGGFLRPPTAGSLCFKCCILLPVAKAEAKNLHICCCLPAVCTLRNSNTAVNFGSQWLCFLYLDEDQIIWTSTFLFVLSSFLLSVYCKC